MKERFLLNEQLVLEDKFLYVASPASKSKNKFIQKADCIENSYNEDIQDYDYISMITKEKYSDGVTVRVKCSFEKFGAPLIVITDDFQQMSDGSFRYGLHFEVVAYENGCNVWHIVPGKEGKNPIDVTKVNCMEFSVKDQSIINMEVKIQNKQLMVRINDKTMIAKHEDIPSQMHIGITACEGINQFYELEIEP